MRNAYLRALYDLAKIDSRVVSLVADNGIIVYDDFKNDFPNRYYNFGISEENMVAASAGIASCGMIPYIYTISAFLSYRSYEFIRDDICFQNQNVKIVGIGTGLTYSTLGPSHHTTEDIGLLRAIPNLTIFSPATKKELEWIMDESYRIDGPVYIRLGNNNKEYYKQDINFEVGRPAIVQEGKDVTVFTTGPILNEVMNAVDLLKQDNISAQVISVHTLKPMDTKAIVKLVKNTSKTVVVEEHNIISGLFSAIAEAMVIENYIVPTLRIGLNDTFAVDYGSLDNVRQANHIDNLSIYGKIKEFVCD